MITGLFWTSRYSLKGICTPNSVENELIIIIHDKGYATRLFEVKILSNNIIVSDFEDNKHGENSIKNKKS